ncbi:MAG: hypothetical protein ABIQ44_11105 [Chloroflexia bacterium]
MDNSNMPQNVGPQGAGQSMPPAPQVQQGAALGQYVPEAQSAGAGQAPQGAPPVGGQPGTKPPEEELTAGKVATSCLLAIPILILAQVGEFIESIWDLTKWIISLFRNKWFLLGFAVVVIFLILAAIGGGMQSTTP